MSAKAPLTPQGSDVSKTQPFEKITYKLIDQRSFILIKATSFLESNTKIIHPNNNDLFFESNTMLSLSHRMYGADA